MMAYPPRPIAFVLASTDHGTMIVNRFDYKMFEPGKAYGVGITLLGTSSYDPYEVSVVAGLLNERRRHFGDGVRLLDIGANIGVFTVEWAKHMTGWGNVLAFEAQERLFHALAGNIAINNCFNARPIWAAVANESGVIGMPVPNYLEPGSFGSLELRPRERSEGIGQPVDYDEAGLVDVTAVTVDSLDLDRLDLMKVDVEGMEMEVLEGARRAIEQHLPIMMIEDVKIDRDELWRFLDGFGYKLFPAGMNVVAIHPTDRSIHSVRQNPPSPA